MLPLAWSPWPFGLERLVAGDLPGAFLDLARGLPAVFLAMSSALIARSPCLPVIAAARIQAARRDVL